MRAPVYLFFELMVTNILLVSSLVDDESKISDVLILYFPSSNDDFYPLNIKKVI